MGSLEDLADREEARERGRQHPDQADAQRQASTAALCRGALTMLRNECRVPRDAALAEVARTVEPDRITVFANRNEFMQHHFNEHLIAAMREDRMRKVRSR